MANSEQLLTTKELAREHRVSLRTLERWKAQGFKMPGRRATLTALRDWLAGNDVKRRELASMR